MMLLEECMAIAAVRDELDKIALMIDLLDYTAATDPDRVLEANQEAAHHVDEARRCLSDALDAMLPGGLAKWQDFFKSPVPIKPRDAGTRTEGG